MYSSFIYEIFPTGKDPHEIFSSPHGSLQEYLKSRLDKLLNLKDSFKFQLFHISVTVTAILCY